MPTVHSLARAGILRTSQIVVRRCSPYLPSFPLTVPNPINYFQLAEVIASNQQTILGHVTQSNIFFQSPADPY